MTNLERIAALIRSEAGLTDSEIRECTGIEPHQQVNQICRRLEARGLIHRRVGPDGLIINIPVGARVGSTRGLTKRPTPATMVSSCDGRRTRVSPVVEMGLPDVEFSRSLVVVPCSGGKCSGGMSDPSDSVSVLDFLPAGLASKLRDQRIRNAPKARVDNALLLSAHQRYTGHLYQAAGNAFDTLINAGAEVLIISGGYGIVHAREFIGDYNRRFCNADWPENLIQLCLAMYAAAADSRAVIGLFSKSGDYRKAFCNTDWPAQVERVDLVTPVTRSQSGAQVTVPRATGEALAAISKRRRLDSDWESSDGLPVCVAKLRP